MPISVQNNRWLARSLAPRDPNRPPLIAIAPRARAGFRGEYAPIGGQQPPPPGGILPVPPPPPWDGMINICDVAGSRGGIPTSPGGTWDVDCPGHDKDGAVLIVPTPIETPTPTGIVPPPGPIPGSTGQITTYIQASETRPIEIAAKAAGNAITALATTALVGPATIESIGIYSAAAGVGTDVWQLIRIDLSRDPALQTFTFNASGVPTGGVPDEKTIFQNSILYDNSGPELTYNSGWYRYQGTSGGSIPEMFRMPINIRVPWSTYYVKVYIQVDEASAREWNIVLSYRTDPRKVIIIPDDGTKTTIESPMTIWGR